MALANIKQEAHHLIDQLPDGSTWNDAIYEMVVRREIELGLVDSDTNNTSSVESTREEYNLD